MPRQPAQQRPKSYTNRSRVCATLMSDCINKFLFVRALASTSTHIFKKNVMYSSRTHFAGASMDSLDVLDDLQPLCFSSLAWF